MDAAFEVERTPEPEPEPEPPRIEVVPNDQAFDLMVLADLSAQQPRRMVGARQQTQEPQQQPGWPSTPTRGSDRGREFSPANLPEDEPMDAPTYPARTSPEDNVQPAVQSAQHTPYALPNGVDSAREPEPSTLR